MAVQVDRTAARAIVAMGSIAISNLCDNIACGCCFEAPAAGEVRIFSRNDRDEQVGVGYRSEGSTIAVDPWPFGVNSYAGYLVGYQLDGYPAVLEPVMLPYSLRLLAHEGSQHYPTIILLAPG